MELAPWQGGPRRVIFTAFGTPVPQGSLKSARRKNARGVTTWHDNEADLKPWRQTVAWAAREAAPGPQLKGAIGVELTFTLDKPRSYPKRVRFPVTKPDLDKLVRAVLDGITDAGLWRDDAQVCRLLAEEVYAGCHIRAMDKAGVVVTVREIEA